MPETIPREDPTRTTESAPSGESEKSKLKITLVETGDIAETQARDVADEKMTASKQEMRGVGGFFKRIWKHNIAEEFYRQREVQKARQAIYGSENIHAASGDITGEDHNAEMKAVVSRYLEEGEGLVHADLGEKREILGDTDAEREIKTSVQELIRAYAGSDMSAETFTEERARILSRVTGAKRETVDRGRMYADNLLEIATQVKNAVDHGASLHELDLDFDIVIGKAKNGVRTEAQFNAVDKITDRIQRSRVGRFANETTLALGVAVVSSAGKAVSVNLVRSKAVAWGTFGASAVVGAAVAGARESRRTEEDRRQHAREMAKGRTVNYDRSPRRAEMEKYRHETVQAGVLCDRLEEVFYAKDKDGKLVPKDLTDEQRRDAMAQLAEIESRVALSDRLKIDLIGYSNERKVAQEQARLDLLRADVKANISRSGLTVNIPEGGTTRAISAKEYYEMLSETRIEQLVGGDSGIEQKNRLFKDLKRKRVASAVAKGLIIGLTVGGLAQEATAFLKDNQEGVVEHVINNLRDHKDKLTGVAHFTPLEYMRRLLSGDLPRMDASDLHQTIIGDTHFNLPEGTEVVHNSDGTVDIMRGDHVIGDNLTVDDRGSLTPEALDQLKSNGVLASSHIDQVAETTTTTSPSEYAEQHPENLHTIKRDVWYDNDTAEFDKNELRLRWGNEISIQSENDLPLNAGIDAQGNYMFNVQHMTADGSFHDGLTTDAQELRMGGKLMLLLSMSRDTQNHVFEIPINEHGLAVIDPQSEAGRMLFQAVDGKPVFVGKFAEIAQMMDVKDGAEHVRILATHVGEGLKGVTDTVEGVKDVPITNLDMPADYRVDPPPFIPILGRRPLEPSQIEAPPIYYAVSGGESSKEDRELRREQLSDKLKKNPDADIDQHGQIKEYLDRMNPKYREYVKSVASDLGPMHQDCRVTLCIPAAGHQEGENIYHTLENLTNQTADNNSFEIAVMVNHPEKSRSGEIITPDKTLEEIKRFQREHPDMQVKVVYRAIPNDKARIGYIRKVLSDAVLMRHAARGVAAKEHIMVSNDADCLGVAKEYIENFIRKFDANSKVDSMLGQLDWDPESFAQHPAEHIATRFMQYVGAISRTKRWWIGSSGANFAYKAGMYAGVGGYNPNKGGAEDDDLGLRFKEARAKATDKSRTSIGYAGSASRLYTSSRRSVEAMRRGRAPVEQWQAVQFGTVDDEIRTMKLDKVTKDIDFDELDRDPVKRRDFILTIEHFINRSITSIPGLTGRTENPEPDSSTRRALGWLGIRYEFVHDNTIKITNADKMIEGLKRYQKDWKKTVAKKTGQSVRDSAETGRRTKRTRRATKPRVAAETPKTDTASTATARPAPERPRVNA